VCAEFVISPPNDPPNFKIWPFWTTQGHICPIFFSGARNSPAPFGRGSPSKICRINCLAVHMYARNSSIRPKTSPRIPRFGHFGPKTHKAPNGAARPKLHEKWSKKLFGARNRGNACDYGREVILPSIHFPAFLTPKCPLVDNFKTKSMNFTARCWAPKITRIMVQIFFCAPRQGSSSGFGRGVILPSIHFPAFSTPKKFHPSTGNAEISGGIIGLRTL
jgi:hypothetical protein